MSNEKEELNEFYAEHNCCSCGGTNHYKMTYKKDGTQFTFKVNTPLPPPIEDWTGKRYLKMSDEKEFAAIKKLSPEFYKAYLKNKALFKPHMIRLNAAIDACIIEAVFGKLISEKPDSKES